VHHDAPEKRYRAVCSFRIFNERASNAPSKQTLVAPDSYQPTKSDLCKISYDKILTGTVSGKT